MSLPLKQKNILVTREVEQANLFAEKISRFGGNPLVVPLLEITCKRTGMTTEVLENISQYDWILFTSANGVDCFFELWDKEGMSPTGIFAKMATVGEKTSIALKKYGYEAYFTPTTYNANTMASEFLNKFPNPGNLLLIRGNRSRNVVPDQLGLHGIDFEMLEVYDTHFSYEKKEKLNQALAKSNLDYVTFTSPSAVEAFSEMIDVVSNSFYCVCIGSTTSKRAEELGFQFILTAETFTIDGMIQRISDHIEKG